MFSPGQFSSFTNPPSLPNPSTRPNLYRPSKASCEKVIQSILADEEKKRQLEGGSSDEEDSDFSERSESSDSSEFSGDSEGSDCDEAEPGPPLWCTQAAPESMEWTGAASMLIG